MREIICKMPINIDKLTDYYAQANFLYRGAAEDILNPGTTLRNSSTDYKLCGIVIPLSGIASVHFNNTPYLVKPGMIVHATPRTKLDRDIIGNEAWRCIRLYFSLPEKEVFSLPFFHEHFSVSTGISLRITDIAQQLLANTLASGSTAVLRRKSLFQNLIEEIALSAQRQCRNDNGGLVDDAIAFMHENYSRQFSIAELAAQYGMTGTRFGQLFQRHVGRAPLDYLTRLRMNCAKELLKTCDCSITQVAECVGYIDPYYFSKSFKKIIGLSPTEFKVSLENFHHTTRK